MKLRLRFLPTLPVLALVAVASTSGCAAPTEDDDADEGVQLDVEPPADPDDRDNGEEDVGTTASAATEGCPNSGSGAQLLKAYRSGNFNWVTVLRDTRRDGKTPNVRVEITDTGSAWGGRNTKVYTHRLTKGCGTSGSYAYHIKPPVCGRGGSYPLRVRMWLRNGTKTVSSREVYTKIDCVI